MPIFPHHMHWEIYNHAKKFFQLWTLVAANLWIKVVGIIFEEKIILSVQILFHFGFKLQNINAQKTNATLNTF